MTTDLAVHAQGVTRRYGSFTAVDGVDLDIRTGELFALLGTNGAGKTSFLELLEGLAPAHSGEIRVLGAEPYKQRRQVISRLGIMLQDVGFSGDLTVAETARMWHGTLSHPRPVTDALGQVNLTKRADVRVASLSGGERRRLDLALAVMGGPDLLFLDEPTTGLDPESRRAAWDLVRGLLDGGTTVVLTTHYLEEAEALADRLAIMHGGRIVRRGTVGEIVASEPARIAFELHRDDHRHLPVLPGLIGTPATVGERVEMRSGDLQRDLHALLAWADERDLTLADLDARSASLEQAFLAVAGTDQS